LSHPLAGAIEPIRQRGGYRRLLSPLFPFRELLIPSREACAHLLLGGRPQLLLIVVELERLLQHRYPAVLQPGPYIGGQASRALLLLQRRLLGRSDECGRCGDRCRKLHGHGACESEPVSRKVREAVRHLGH